MNVDNYRVLLFKKKIRSLVRVPWLRFYWSKDKSHMCILARDFKSEDFESVTNSMRQNKIDFKMSFWELFGESIPYSMDIPVDQEALPERKH